MQNFVYFTDPIDRNAESTGCATAFLSWLMCQGHPLNVIAPAMVSLSPSHRLVPLAKLSA